MCFMYQESTKNGKTMERHPCHLLQMTCQGATIQVPQLVAIHLCAGAFRDTNKSFCSRTTTQEYWNWQVANYDQPAWRRGAHTLHQTSQERNQQEDRDRNADRKSQLRSHRTTRDSRTFHIHFSRGRSRDDVPRPKTLLEGRKFANVGN